ncbi:restriction endonuclease fold toxin 5 domain-containing protein [Achromobacter aloeverae]
MEKAAETLARALVRAGVNVLAGGAVVAGTASLPGDTQKDDSKATPIPRTLPRTGERCRKCPPDAGYAENINRGMPPGARKYQGYVTGRPYGIEPYDDRRGWNEEWRWNGVDWDGFVPNQCLLQEAKANYDIFFERWAVKSGALDDLKEQLTRQAAALRPYPSTRLRWYFQTPKAYAFMQAALIANNVESELKEGP